MSMWDTVICCLPHTPWPGLGNGPLTGNQMHTILWSSGWCPARTYCVIFTNKYIHFFVYKLQYIRKKWSFKQPRGKILGEWVETIVPAISKGSKGDSTEAQGYEGQRKEIFLLFWPSRWTNWKLRGDDYINKYNYENWRMLTKMCLQMLARQSFLLDKRKMEKS